MQISIQSSQHYGELLGDARIAEILDASTETASMIRVELALAKAQSALGMIPATAGEQLEAVLEGFTLDADQLRQGVSGSGVPVPALLAELRKALPAELSQWLHWGATSQDIVDTASMLQIADCLELFETRLSDLLDSLHSLSIEHANTLMAARTRTQLATPITLGLRLAQWAQPLIGLENELPSLKAFVLRLQFGGSAGANTAVSPHGPAIAAAMAKALSLSNAPPWHTDRSGVIRLAGWLLQTCLSLGKMARDQMIMTRSEIAEIRAGLPGGSSTMPQKANPVQSEVVVALSTVAQSLHSGLCASASPLEERDGSSWTVEWILLPQLLISTACALRHSLSLVDSLTVDRQRMLSIVTENSQLMCEAASFALAEHMPRTEAQALVRQAAASTLPLHQALAQICRIDMDWDRILDPHPVSDSCQQISDSIFANRNREPDCE